MDPIVVSENTWLSKKPHEKAGLATTVFVAFLLALSFAVFAGALHAEIWLPATPGAVFQQHQWWRAWTTVFVHGDYGHLFSNMLLLLPLTFLLAGYYGPFLLPLLAVAVGGLINLVVLRTLPAEVTLLGISGVVYWMGSTWLTLYILISRKVRLRRRLAYALFVSLMLFVPETYKPEISYLSHFVGFLFGIITAFIVYAFQRRKFLAAESTVFLIETPIVPEPWACEQASCNSGTGV